MHRGETSVAGNRPGGPKVWMGSAIMFAPPLNTLQLRRPQRRRFRFATGKVLKKAGNKQRRLLVGYWPERCQNRLRASQLKRLSQPGNSIAVPDGAHSRVAGAKHD